MEQHARLLALRDKANEAKLAYWVEQISIQADVVRGLSLCAEGKPQECLDALQQAAAREDASEKHVVTPGPILPARELLADILLEDDQPAEALAEYEAVLAKEPNRYRAVAGAMEAAEKAGDLEKARAHAAHLLEQAAEADSERSSLQLARQIGANQ
jgi:tetratricopeptide (TPR) repeat protein